VSKPDISICMATYNGAQYLAQQIDSILTQSYQEWELLIRDDQSTDNTTDILREYRDRYPDKIRIIDENGPHLGIILNFNRLLDVADSDYIMFCDHDDVWLSDKIEQTLSAMKATEQLHPQKPILVHTDLRVVDQDLNTISDSLWNYQRLFPDIANNPSRIMAHNVVTGCTVMINRQAKTVSTPIPPQAVMHDWWVAIKVAQTGKIVHISTPTILYRQHSDNELGAKHARAINIVNFLKKLCKIKKLLSLQYAMIKKADPKASFSAMILNKTIIKISQRLR